MDETEFQQQTLPDTS